MSHEHVGHRQRLRERYLKNGLEGFHDYEIVELLLTLGTPRRNCKSMAKQALKKFGSLSRVLEAPIGELESIKGIGPNNVFGLKLSQSVARMYLAERLKDRDYITCSNDVHEFLIHHLRDKNREVFLVIFLNGRNQFIGHEQLFEGTLTSSAVYPREVVQKVLFHDAAAVVLVHNHPSGNPKPSLEDKTITSRLKTALESIDVSVHDHLIVAGNNIFSFADEGMI